MRVDFASARHAAAGRDGRRLLFAGAGLLAGDILLVRNAEEMVAFRVPAERSAFTTLWP